MSILLIPARTIRQGPWSKVRSVHLRPLLVPTIINGPYNHYRQRPFATTSPSNNKPHANPNLDPKTPPDESRWSDVKSSVLVLLSVCSAALFPTKQAACDDLKASPRRNTPVLELKPDSKDPKGQDVEKEVGKDKEAVKDKEKIKLTNPLPTIQIPMISLDDLMEKVQDLGEKIGEEILGHVPTLADYFTAVDALRRELQLGDGSLYQSIVSNMSDANKNPEIQLDATVRQGNDICPQEIAFQAARKKKMKKAFAKFIGVKESDVNENDIPIIAVAGSGGGYRAMISTLGYMAAAKKAGLFDCMMYMAGVSGSCWLIAQYLTLGQRSFTKTMEHFKQSLNVPIAHYPSFIDTMLTNPGAAQLILEGVVQKYSKNRVLTLVDGFGTVLASRLLIHRERDGDNGEWVDPLDFKLSQQSRWINYGDQPLPIYTAVSHVLPGSTAQPGPMEEIIVDDEVDKEDSDEHYYQWFEMTPYEFGSEETSAWIPTWSFGRRFVEGKSVERIPETNLAILLGTFGSAFTATLADYYNEIRPLLNKSMSDSMDSYIKDYLDNMSLIHPLSPSCFPNPIYKLPNPAPEAEAFSQRKNIYLNDAGMDNNLPLYPLLRPGRKVDVILAFDSSADIESVPWFEKADEYVKRRGIERWPPISKTRAEQLAKQEGGPPRKMTHIEIFHGIAADNRDADHVVPVEKKNKEPNPENVTPHQKPDAHPITLIYFPLIPNQEYQTFDPSTEAFCSTFNFVVKEDQVDLLAGLSESNFNRGLEDVRKVLKETWLQKKHERLEREKQERKSRKLNTTVTPSASTPEKDTPSSAKHS